MRRALAAAASPVRVEIREALGDARGLERGARAVEVDEAPAVDLPAQGRVERADGLDVERGLGRGRGRQGRTALMSGIGFNSP